MNLLIPTLLSLRFHRSDVAYIQVSILFMYVLVKHKKNETDLKINFKIPYF